MKIRVIQVFADGSMDEVCLREKLKGLKLEEGDKRAEICKIVRDLSKSQGDGEIKSLYTWSHCDNEITCYGWYDGDAGFENKHELPPNGKSTFLDEDSSVQLLFGDLFLVMNDVKGICDFVVSDYSEFYSLIHGGYDDCDDSEDSSEPDPESEDEDYVEGDELTNEPVEENSGDESDETSEGEFLTETETDSEFEEDEADYSAL